MDIKPIHDQFTCKIFNKGKIHQLPYKDSVNCSTCKLDLVHSDICGSFNVESILYKLVVQDILQRSLTVTRNIPKPLCLRNVQIFLLHLKIIRNESRKKLAVSLKLSEQAIPRSTFPNEFKNYLEAKGIKPELNVEYTPQQNGSAEGTNRTLVEMARCTLIQFELPKSLWGETINTTVW